jgi:Chaperone of endosialidase
MSTSFDFPLNPTIGDTVTLPNGSEAQWNGYAWVPVSADSVVYPIAIDKGGTNAITAPEARINLGLNTSTGEFIIPDGTPAAPGLAFASELTLGIYRDAPTSIGFAASRTLLNGSSAETALVVNAITGADNYGVLYGFKSGIARWAVVMPTGTAESGGNVGSDFAIQRYADDGTYLGASVTINRATGAMDVYGRLGTNSDIATSAGNLSISGTGLFGGSLTVNGSTNNIGNFDSSSGMGFRWDGGDANYLGMGAGLGSAWSWQYIRSTGSLGWLNWESRNIFSIDGNGNGIFAGGVNFNGTNDGTNSIWAAQRITCNRVDAAAIYIPQGGIQIGGSGNALNLTAGSAYVAGDVNGQGIVARSVVYSNPNNGLQWSPGSYDNGAGGYKCCIAYGGPNYANMGEEFFHQGSQWVGWHVYGEKELRWSVQSGALNADAFTPWSDRRLKKDITIIDDARSKVAAITGYTFTPIDTKDYNGNEIRRAGLIAQEVLQVLSESVSLDSSPLSFMEDFKDTDPDTPGKRYSLDYNGVIALLVNDNNAMAARIDALETRLAALEQI